MTIYISLLRGINVGGSKILSMGSLSEIYSGLGFNQVRTYLQSGNVIFTSPVEDRALLACQIEARIEQACGFNVSVFLRQPQDFRHIITHHPFVELAIGETGKLHVSFLYNQPAESAWNKLAILPEIPDKLARGEMAIYLYYPNGSAKSKIPTSYLEKVLGVPITDRNWNTVNALYRIAKEL
jgi:uncharacterized protein (DUF1697 family)